MLDTADAGLEGLLTDCGSGSMEAFAELYDLTVACSLRLAWCHARERIAAERAVLDAYVEVWRTAPTFDPVEGSAIGWVLSAVHRHRDPLLRPA